LIAELDVVGWQNGEGYFCHLESNLVLMILNSFGFIADVADK
jgi:hypothetical protein